LEAAFLLDLNLKGKSIIDTRRNQPSIPVVSSTIITIGNAENNPSISNVEKELKVASKLRKFSFKDLI
jgi:hypothetical protein